MKMNPKTCHRFFATALVYYLTCVTSAVVAGEPSVLEIPTNPVAMPVAVLIENNFNRDRAAHFELIELDATNVGLNLALPVQIIPAAGEDGTLSEGEQQLLVMIPPNDSARRTRRFRPQPSKNKPLNQFRFEAISEASLGIWQSDQPVLVYNHGKITDQRVPKNDHRRHRHGCYIHPVWGLDGEVITDDFPKDHYHHHGIFWTWPHVRIGKEEYDLWTYSNIEQRFVRWIHRETGPIAAVLAVENGWYVGARQVMIERVWIRTFAAQGGRRAIDISMTWIPIDRAITLQGAAGKSYGGLTMRFASRDDKQTTITVPAGRSTEDLPDTPLPWADYTSQFVGAQALSGATVMIPPTHPDFPPSWLTRHYGALCVGYPGVQAKSFPAGKAFTLNYRVSVHGNSAQLENIKQDYNAYTSAMKVYWSE